MDLKVENGLYIVQIDKAILVMSKEDFIKALQMGKWWKRRQASAPRHATMQEHADQRRSYHG
jgi:hypothetical protein